MGQPLSAIYPIRDFEIESNIFRCFKLDNFEDFTQNNNCHH